MEKSSSSFSLKVGEVSGVCPVGEEHGIKNRKEGNIPVLSCEGACIRGEIARVAANLVSKEKGYARCCHAETFTVPYSAIAEWVKNSEKVVMIDGCFLRCHGRILKNLIDDKCLIGFDALSHYKKYMEIFDVDDVPEDERKKVARAVADWVLASLKKMQGA